MMNRVRVEVRGRHARLTFDDGQMNLLSHAGLDAIGEALDAIHPLVEEGSVSPPAVVTFESGRPGLFAAGADMAEMRGFGPREASEFSRKGQELFRRLTRFPALTGAIVDGDCFGGALDFLMAFDVRIATPPSRFSHPGGKIGIVTGFGGTATWRTVARPGAVGALFLNNEIIAAKRARELGIIHFVDEAPGAVVSRLIDEAGRMRGLPKLKGLASTEKNLASLVLLAKRLDSLYRSGRQDGRKGVHGDSRNTSRHLFG